MRKPLILAGVVLATVTVVLATLAAPAAAQTPPTVTATNLSAGTRTAVSGHVDTTVTVSGLVSTSTYTITINPRDGLGFDPGTTCQDRTRTYTVTGVTSVDLPETGVSHRVYVCLTNTVASIAVTVATDGQSNTTTFPVDATNPTTSTHTLTVQNLPSTMVEGDRVGWAYTLDIAAGQADAIYAVRTEIDSPPAAASLGDACDGATETVLEAEYDDGTHEAAMYLTACYPAVVTVRLTLSQLDQTAGVYIRLGAPVIRRVTITAADNPALAVLGLAFDSTTTVTGSVSTRLTLTGLAERLNYAVTVQLTGNIGYDRDVCADQTRTYLVSGVTTIEFPAAPATEAIHVCGTGDAGMRVELRRAGVSNFVWNLPVGAVADRARPTLAVTGVPDRISTTIDWTVTAGTLDAEVPYTLTVTLPQGLALDSGCTLRSRTYQVTGVTTYDAPPPNEALRLQPCVVGDHTILVSLQAPGDEVIRREVEVTVDETNITETMEEGLLLKPTVAAIVGARRYGDLVLVIYHVDYPDVDLLPDAADAWWVDGQAGGDSVISAQPIAYARRGWGHGIVSLTFSAEDVTQVTLTGMPGRYAEPLDVTEPVIEGGDLGGDVLLALRGLEAMPEWQGQDLVAGEFLGPDGIPYAEDAIPGLRDLAPGIYSSRVIEVAGAPAQATTRTDQGIVPVSALTGMTGAAARTLNLPEVTFRMLATAIIAIVAAAAAITLSGSGLAALPVIALVMVGGTIIGFIPLGLTLAVALLSAMVLAYVLWGKRA